jgi:Family of unknown function (DUF6088)
MAATAKIIRRRVEHGRVDRFWRLRDFASLPTHAVTKTLSRLAEKGVVHRVSKGVYYRAKKTRFGETKPDLTRVFTDTLDRKDLVWKPTGLSVWNSLGLTTQVPAVATFAVERRVRLKSALSVRVREVHSLHTLSAEERAALDALRALRFVPDTTPSETISRLVDLSRKGRLSFSRMSRAALHDEPPRVRALLGLMGTLLGEDDATLEKLRHSLNPTTIFKLGLSATLSGAAAWGIR